MDPSRSLDCLPRVQVTKQLVAPEGVLHKGESQELLPDEGHLSGSTVKLAFKRRQTD